MQSINQSGIKSFFHVEQDEDLDSFSASSLLPFCASATEGTASRKEGMRVENLEQKVIRAGYEENTEDFQTAQMFRDIFHRLASWSPCPCVWAAWRGPGSAACLAPWAALLQKCFRRVLPVERAFIGSPWL